MYELLRMNWWSVLLHLILLLYSGLASLPAPTNLAVDSLNFHHVLRWDPGPGTPPGTVYQIFRRESRRRWKHVSNSTTTSCVLRLHRRWTYNLIVQASYNHTLSPRSKEYSFSALSDTKIGPPEFSLAGCGNCIRVNVTLPQADRGSQNNDIQSFYDAEFKVSLRKKEEQTVRTLLFKEKSFTLTDLQNRTEYCVQVEMVARLNKNTLPSGWKCTFTSVMDLRTSSAVLVAGTLAVILLGVIVATGATSLQYTGIICKLKAAVPRGLMSGLSQGSTLTPERTIPDWISIGSEAGNRRKHDNPTAPPPNSADSEVEEDEDDEDDEGNLYLNRGADLPSGGASHQDSGNVTGNSEDSVGVSAKVEAPLDELHQEEAKGAQGPALHQGDPATGEEEEEEEDQEMPDISGNVNLFSVTLAALAGGEEEEEEEEDEQNTEDNFTDFLKRSSLEPLLSPDLNQTLSHRHSQTEPGDPTPEAMKRPLCKDFTEAGYEGRSTATMTQLEEEEEEEFSGYLGHR